MEFYLVAQNTRFNDLPPIFFPFLPRDSFFFAACVCLSNSIINNVYSCARFFPLVLVSIISLLLSQIQMETISSFTSFISSFVQTRIHFVIVIFYIFFFIRFSSTTKLRSLCLLLISLMWAIWQLMRFVCVCIFCSAFFSLSLWSNNNKMNIIALTIECLHV